MPRVPAERGGAPATALRYGADVLRRHGMRLLLVFAGLLMPLWLLSGGFFPALR